MTSVVEKLYSLKEVAELTGLSHTQVMRYAHRGVLQASRIGPTWVVTAGALDKFMSAPRRMGPAPKLQQETVVRKLERRLRAGDTVKEAMAVIGLHPDRYYRMMRSDPQFRARMEAARAVARSSPRCGTAPPCWN
jgi:excisionase family DNA binding protein